MPLVEIDSAFPLVTTLPLDPERGDPIGTVTALAVLGERAYLVDLFQSVVRVFDRRSGAALGKLSRSGDGPGELRRPVAIEIDSAAGVPRLMLLDRARQVVTVLDTSGKHHRQVPVPGNWTAMAFVPEARRLVVAGIASAVSDAEALATRRMDVVHELDAETGESLASYIPFIPPSRVWEGVFNNASVAATKDITVSGAFNTNTLHVRDNASADVREVVVGGPWFRPIEWPATRDAVPGTSNADRMNRWSRQQQILVRVFLLPSRDIVAQFRAYDASGETEYAYVIVRADRDLLASTSFSRFQLLRVHGDTLFGVVSDSAGDVSLETRLVRPSS